MAAIEYVKKKQDFIFDKGNDFYQVVNCTQGGGVINFTGYTARMQIRNALTNEVVLLLTNTSGITLSSSGVLTISISRTVTNTMTAIDYVYDLDVINTSDFLRTYFGGKITVNQDITANV